MLNYWLGRATVFRALGRNITGTIDEFYYDNLGHPVALRMVPDAVELGPGDSADSLIVWDNVTRIDKEPADAAG